VVLPILLAIIPTLQVTSSATLAGLPSPWPLKSGFSANCLFMACGFETVTDDKQDQENNQAGTFAW